MAAQPITFTAITGQPADTEADADAGRVDEEEAAS